MQKKVFTMNAKKTLMMLLMAGVVLVPVLTFGVSYQEIDSKKNIRISQTRFIKKVCEKNFDIKYQKYDLELAAEQIKKEQAIFEPNLTASFTHEDSISPNTAEEFFDRLGKDSFQERTSQYKVGVSGLFPTGTIYSVDYSIDEVDNDLIDSRYDDDTTKEASSYVGIQLTHPLLKNSGTKNTEAKIMIAKAAKDISFQAYRQKIIDIMFNALNSYWELYYTSKQYEIYNDSVQIAADLLKTYQEMVEVGKVAETELFEIKSALALRQSLLSAAYQKLMSAQNSILQLLGQSRKTNQGILYIPTDKPVFYDMSDTIKPDDILQQAMMYNPRYLSSLKNIKKQDIHIDYAKNQCLPELNLKANAGVTSLDKHPEKFFQNIWNDNDERWSVGLEFKLPLIGNLDQNSELRMTKIRKKQAALSFQAIKVHLENEVDNSIQNIHSSKIQVDRHKENVALKQKIMSIEMNKLEAGKSNIIDVLEKEKKLNQSKNGLLRAIVNMELSGISLRKVDGTLIERYGVHIEKE
jgi:outer membrane protein TolC